MENGAPAEGRGGTGTEAGVRCFVVVLEPDVAWGGRSLRVGGGFGLGRARHVLVQRAFGLVDLTVRSLYPRRSKRIVKASPRDLRQGGFCFVDRLN